VSKYEKKFEDRKQPDMRVVTTVKGPVGQMLNLELKPIWTFMVCCIKGCSNPTKTRGGALCLEHKRIIRLAQYGVASTKYRDSGKLKPKPRLWSRSQPGRPSYRALANPRAALAIAGKQMKTEDRAEFQKALKDSNKLVNLLRAGTKAVKRVAAKATKKKRNEREAVKARAKLAKVSSKPSLKELISGKGEAVASAVARKMAVS
jgi:hypothetical protein